MSQKRVGYRSYWGAEHEPSKRTLVDTYDDKFLQKVEHDQSFHIGQSYEEKAAITMQCIFCLGREFNVGVGNYFTAIRCVKCEWELCIHEG